MCGEILFDSLGVLQYVLAVSEVLGAESASRDFTLYSDDPQPAGLLLPASQPAHNCALIHNPICSLSRAF